MKKIITFAVLLLLSVSFALPAFAKEQKFHYLESERDVVISVSWPTEQPKLTFKAPNGTVYDPLSEKEGTLTVVNEKSMYYVIKNAPAGQWYVDLDKLGNDTVEIGMFDYQDAPVIESFTLGEEKDGRMDVSFRVTQDEDRSYSYKIYAAVKKGGDEKELTSGSARTNSDVKTSVDLRSLSSYSAYMLKLYVWYSDNETDYFDQVYSETFSYKNSDKASSMKDFGLSVDPDAALLYVSWPGIDYNADGVLAAVFENDEAKPSFYDTYEPEIGEVQLSYDPSASSVRVELSVMIDGVYSDTMKKTADVANPPISLEDTTETNIPSLRLDYKDLKSAAVTVTVGETENDLELDGTGTMSVKLQDDWNDVSVSYTDGNGVNWLLSRRVFVDRTAPVLKMNDTYDGMVVSASELEISGNVADAYIVTVNGNQTEIASDGTFTYKLQLSGGENELTVTASDKFGNESRYSAVITSTAGGYSIPSSRSDSASGNSEMSALEKIFSPDGFLWITLSGALCLMITVYAIVFWRRGNKKTKPDSTGKTV